MAKRLTRCPVCESALNVSEFSCSRCQTRIQGAFDSCRFCRLAPEHLAFVEMFLRCEGNLSRVERELNVSYPTVRNRFAAALAALGFGGETQTETATPDDFTRRRETLEALARGDISAAEAADALRGD